MPNRKYSPVMLEEALKRGFKTGEIVGSTRVENRTFYELYKYKDPVDAAISFADKGKLIGYSALGVAARNEYLEFVADEDAQATVDAIEQAWRNNIEAAPLEVLHIWSEAMDIVANQDEKLIDV